MMPHGAVVAGGDLGEEDGSREPEGAHRGSEVSAIHVVRIAGPDTRGMVL